MNARDDSASVWPADEADVRMNEPVIRENISATARLPSIVEPRSVVCRGDRCRHEITAMPVTTP